MKVLQGTTILLAVTLCAVGAFAFALYRWIDAGISLDHARQEQVVQERTIQLLRDLLRASARHLTRADVLSIAQRDLQADQVLKERGDRIQIGGVIFELKEDKVVDVLLLEEEP